MRWIALTIVALSASLIRADDVAPETPKVVCAKITDDGGKAIEDGQQFELGDVIALSARQSVRGDKQRSVIWSISPGSLSAKAKLSADGLDVYIPTGIEPNDITVTLFVSLADEGDVSTVRVRCGSGPRPPPPTPPGPGPQPPPKASRLQLIVVEDVLNRTVATAQIVNATAAWQQFRTQGHETKFYDAKTQEANGKRYVAEVGSKKLPALLIRDADKDSTLEIVSPLTALEQVTSAVERWKK